MSENIFFSIIIPTYNRVHLLPKSIDSVLAQTYQNYELIIIDDGSTDNTKDRVALYNNPKITYLLKTHEERGIARNTGIQLAKGDYITFLDSDDLFYPNHLAHASDMIKKFNFPEFYRQAYEVKNENGKILERKHRVSGDANKFILSGNYFSCIGVFLQKKVTIDCKFSNLDIAPSEDWEYWLRLSVRHKFYYDNTITAFMVNHPGRSMLHFDEKSVRNNINRIILSLESDSIFMEQRSEYIKVIRAQMITLMCLRKVVHGVNKGLFKDLFIAYSMSFGEIFRRRTLAIIKYYLLNILFPK